MLLSLLSQGDIRQGIIKSCRHLLLACLLYEKNRRLLSKLKMPEDYQPYDLVRVSESSVPEGYRTESIYGFPHAHLLINK